MKNLFKIFIIVLIFIFSSCSDKDLDPTLVEEKDVETSITSEEDLQGLIYGTYDVLSSYFVYGRDLIAFGEVRSDNNFPNGNSGRFSDVGAMVMNDASSYAADTWRQLYATIANANIIINLDLSTIEGQENSMEHIQGQALAVRALAHFDLLKLYGQQHVDNGGEAALGIPYVTDYKGENLVPERGTVAENKTQIYQDLDKALAMMSEAENGSCEVFTTHAVNALISRVAVYFGDWDIALTSSKLVIDSGEYSIIGASNYATTFNTDCTMNAVFEIAVSETDEPANNSLATIYQGETYADLQVQDNVLDLFDDSDVRGVGKMIGYEDTHPTQLRNLGKYPFSWMNIPIIRYEEVVLNYAEALYESGDSPAALTWLNEIPSHRNATVYSAVNKENILKERRKELIFEGFRFDDLARTKQDLPNPNPLQATHNGPAYGSYKYAFPIPRAEMNANPNMKQNEGYY